MTSNRLIAALILCVCARALTLEYPDLTDPTEARYAFVAQEMVISGNWVVPKIPWHETLIPYLGKPPAHFWLTALSFSLFGMDEWVARLPSFCALLVSVASLLYLGRFEAFKARGLLASVILSSSALMFFMSF